MRYQGAFERKTYIINVKDAIQASVMTAQAIIIEIATELPRLGGVDMGAFVVSVLSSLIGSLSPKNMT